jgi:hypothetical protein
MICVKCKNEIVGNSIELDYAIPPELPGDVALPMLPAFVDEKCMNEIISRWKGASLSLSATNLQPTSEKEDSVE